MTHLLFDPTEFKERMLTGLVDAYERYIERVPNASGVMRVGGARAGKVAVVIGGGCGHYPAFAGLVGPGLADGAVVGDVFTSPSAEQAYRVGAALDGGAGVLFSFGNYAGDVLNFGAAQQRLRNDGHDCRTVLVTDDVASAATDERDLRRGIAGGLMVFKAAGAAAARGDGLAEVERIARKANASARTLGVAFAACTLPGQSQPLFDVAPDTYELGMGIHGEAGIKSTPAVPVDELARMLVEPLLAERPADSGDEVAVVLNGLGSTKYEELLILWGEVSLQLKAAGIRPVLPEVGEFITSLDMAGCSLTLGWLDPELRELWSEPVDTPAFRRGEPSRWPTFPAAEGPAAAKSSQTVERPASDESKRAAAVVRAALAAMLDAVGAHADELGRLDAVAGDGDHGLGMTRGLRAAVEASAAAPDAGAYTVLREAARAFADRAGGTSGLLWGVLLEAIGETLGDDRAVTTDRLAEAMARASETVRQVGGAERNDKTLVDVLEPFSERLSDRASARASLVDAWNDASDVADQAAAATAALVSRRGRSRPLGERSLGTVDPGAHSLALCIRAVGGVLATSCASDKT